MHKLPPETKAELERKLLDQSHDGYVKLSEWLDGIGYKISKSALHTYDQQLQRVRERILVHTETVRHLSLMTNGVDFSTMAIQFAQAALSVATEELLSDKNIPPTDKANALSQAARALADTVRASTNRERWQDEAKTRAEQASGREKKTIDIESFNVAWEMVYGR